MTAAHDGTIREDRLTEGERTELGSAEALELDLRRRVADLVTERRRVAEEVARLERRAGLPGADPALAETAARYRTRAEALEREVDETRRRLRVQEAAVAALRADRDLGPDAPTEPGGDA